MIASTREFCCEYSRVQASSIASAREYDYEYWSVRLQVVTSILELSTRNSRVGNALLVCARSHSRLALMCDIANGTSHSHACVQKRILWRREKSF